MDGKHNLNILLYFHFLFCWFYMLSLYGSCQLRYLNIASISDSSNLLTSILICKHA